MKVAQEISGTADPAGLRAIGILSRLSWGLLGDGGGRGDLGTRTAINTTTKSKATSRTGARAKTATQAKADASTATDANTAADTSSATNAGAATNYRWKKTQSPQLFSVPAVPNPDPGGTDRWQVGKVLTDAHSTLAFSRHPVGKREP